MDEEKLRPRFITTLKEYQTAATIFSGIMVAGSFMANSKDPNISFIGSSFFVSGFFGVIWCVLDNLQIYTSRKLLELLKYLPTIILITVVTDISTSLILLISYVFTTIKTAQPTLIMGFRYFFATLYLASLLFIVINTYYDSILSLICSIAKNLSKIKSIVFSKIKKRRCLCREKNTIKKHILQAFL